jgi:hypothetical protein
MTPYCGRSDRWPTMLRVGLISGLVAIWCATGPEPAVAARWSLHLLPRPMRPGGRSLSARLDGVSCPTPTWWVAVGMTVTSCRAVGNNGCESLAERWNGSRWAVLRTPDAGYCTKRGIGAPSLTGVSCASARACVAVGTIQPLNESQIDRPLTERWNGLRWSMQRTGEVTSALSCPALGSCTAVGVQPPLVNAERWNGIHWTAQPLPVPRTPELGWSLDGVSCASPRRCIAVGGLTDAWAQERPLVAEYRGSAR